jgi:hypothetical protein
MPVSRDRGINVRVFFPHVYSAKALDAVRIKKLGRGLCEAHFFTKPLVIKCIKGYAKGDPNANISSGL